MRDRYGANERSQKLKYHVQTSGRSLHAQEMEFNDIRTTLQALIAIYDNCNSLHTNAYDEAVTTPTEESVRRALAIQLIINREWGLAKNENPHQGVVHHRRADRPGRGGGAGGVRAASASAAACSARWRPATSAAGSRTSRCSTSTRKHDGSLPDHRRQHLPQPRRRRRDAGRRSSWPARPRTRSGPSSSGSPTSRRAHGDERPRGARARSQEAALVGRERVRGADGRRPRVLARRRSPTRCSRSAGSTAATSERP